MRDSFATRLNELLVEIYSAISHVEELTIKNAAFDISNRELHTLEAVGRYKDAGCTISAIAQDLDVTLPTVTVCIKKLEKKEYVQKVRSEEDGRKVRIVLTKKGRRIDAVHRYFHEQMVRSFLKEVPEAERPVLQNALENLNIFLQQQIERAESTAEKDGNQA
ncbi:MarR family transcriptional regulator [Christensenellaceae bacterium OttesenSCG-928-M15]|nr:MarR family transcriptional regulator [Christensenellaceae bacterium OttesenSCG-928-M15]